MKITFDGIQFEASDFKDGKIPDFKPEKRNILLCPRCGDKMEARELDFICWECDLTVEKE